MSVHSRTFGLLPLSVLATVLVSGPALAQADDGWRTIEFETTEVTSPDVAISPDGQWLIFTMLGHLFQLPVEGGTAEQLTFGPYYDDEPVFSPDGRRVAFVSDRDGSEGNVFVLELATGEITQVTDEPWAGRPTWTPDGQAIVYLRFMLVGMRYSAVPALVRRVALQGTPSGGALSGGEPETLSAPPRLFSSVFYLPDGRLAWTVVEREAEPSGWMTRIEVMSSQDRGGYPAMVARGTVSTLRSLAGFTHRVVPSPTGDGLYSRRSVPASSPMLTEQEELLFLPLPAGVEKQLISLSTPAGGRPRFAVEANSKNLYLGDAGQLWKIELPSGTRQLIPFRARVRLKIQGPVPPRKPVIEVAGSSALPRSVLDPRLSPDGRHLVFGAAGYLWQQPLDGGPAERMFEGSGFERNPAFSPDGRQLAFVRSEHGKEEVRVFDFESRQMRTLASGLSNYRDLAWSPDGQRLLFAAAGADVAERAAGPPRAVAVKLGDGKEEKLTDIRWWWGARPHFSPDGQSLYFSGPPGAGPPGAGVLYHLPLKDQAELEPVTQPVPGLTRALVSPAGTWLAFQRNTEIWVAPLGPAAPDSAGLGTEQVREEHVRRLSPEGGDTFAFTPAGSAVIYSAGNRVWQHPVAGGEREEIPIRLELPRPTPPPLLLRRVRVLDFASGGFGRETSLYIEQGRIRWMGSERGRQLSRETVTVDAGGRFAIPGLFDLHVHNYIEGINQQAFLAYGVTSVRDAGAWLPWLGALADRGEATRDPVPRYFFSGAFFGHASWSLPGSHLMLQIHDDEDARTYVRLWEKRGVHFIKIYPPIPWALARVVAEEARRLGLPTVGHGRTLEEITKSVILGYWSLEHFAPPRFYDDVSLMLALTGTRWDPTATLHGGQYLLLRDEPERLNDDKLRTFTPASCIHRTQTEAQREERKALRTAWIKLLAGIRAAHARGVKLQVGTDTEPGTLVCFYGSSVHRELEHFVQAGLAPLEVLRIATQEAAVAVGAEDDLGTLEVGKLADIVLLDANPLEDIKNTQAIWRVIKGGWVFDPEELRPPSGN